MTDDRHRVKKAAGGGGFCCMLLVGGVIVLVGYLNKNSAGPEGKKDNGTSLVTFSNGAVATDSDECSKVGVRILKRGGSAVDAAIASMLCVGVINMHSTGVAGSGFMLVYKRSSRRTEMVNFREKAPRASSKDMFVGMNESRYGGRSIAVPGEVMGYYKAWLKYGNLRWKDLVQPAINIAQQGFKIGIPVYEAAEEYQEKLKKDPGLRELLFDNEGNLLKEGAYITNKKYAATLEEIRDNPYSMYNGPLARKIIRDMKDVTPNGSLEMEDLGNYTIKFEKGFSHWLDYYRVLYTTPPPTSGVLLNLILNILKGYNMPTAWNRYNVNASSLAFHRIAESFKFASAFRSLLADPDFINITEDVRNLLNPLTADLLRQKIWDNKTHNVSYYANFFTKVDHGTSHLAVLARNGDAVSLTSSINYRFGCMFRSTSTGIIYNNGMADFDNPDGEDISGIFPSKRNFPEPGKRPLSSMTPVIITDNNGNVKLIVGASGGKKILTSTALTIINWLWFHRNVSQAVEDPRIHTHLVPDNALEFEEDFPVAIRKGLQKRGHQLQSMKYFAAVQAIEKIGKKIYAKSDPRKHGKPAGY